MRLLHFVGPRLTLTDFTGKTIPPYAILSHRWNDDPKSEVLFEDSGNDTWMNKAGFAKIAFCATQAVQDKLQYFWVDTCCINKWDSRELSKSINSMFRWYQSAAKCYVFMSDISASPTANVTGETTWQQVFRASTWFQRGWTLQELIAPPSVEFFSLEGQRLGDKASLENVIHKITGIPIEALRGHPLQHFSISDRIAWAKNRKTSVPEDAAYCLLGILDVEMPLIYDQEKKQALDRAYNKGEERVIEKTRNEAKAKALSRLNDELQAAKDYPCIIPFFQNERFTGRQAQLDEIETKLFKDKCGRRIVITGEGGTGKSQLALEVAHRTSRNNKHCSIFWIDAGGIDSLRQGYMAIAEKLRLPGWDDQKADRMDLVRLHFSRKEAGQWLLIFDNIQDVDLLPAEHSTGGPMELGKYLPNCELGSILFTSTNKLAARMLAARDLIELEEMTPDTGEQMLQKHMINHQLLLEKDEMQSLLKELSYLPLAIVQAAAYINVSNMTLKEYRSRLRKQEEEAFKLGSYQSVDTTPGGEFRSAVISTLLVSLERIRQDSPLSADYLFSIACVDRKDIPLEMLAADSPRTEDAVRVLNAYALVARRPADGSLDIYRLVQQSMRTWLEKQGWLNDRIQEATRRLVEILPSHNYTNRSKWRRLLPHALCVLDHSGEDYENETRTQLSWNCAMALSSDGQDSQAEQLFKRVMETRKRVLGEEHPDTLTSMANLASTYSNQGRWKEAEELKVRVMETFKRVLGEEHPSTLTSMANLAFTWNGQGRDIDALKLIKQCLDLRVRVLGQSHPKTLSTLIALLQWSGVDLEPLSSSVGDRPTTGNK
jgi:hypothetical protein